MKSSTNFAVKAVLSLSLCAVMVLMTGCSAFKGRETKSLSVGVGAGVAVGTTSTATGGTDKTCCEKGGFSKPANVKNECATPNSAGQPCCQKKCDCKECKCCPACKNGKPCECEKCDCCKSCPKK